MVKILKLKDEYQKYLTRYENIFTLKISGEIAAYKLTREVEAGAGLEAELRQVLGVDDLLRARQVRLVDARGLHLHVIKNIFHVRI